MIKLLVKSCVITFFTLLTAATATAESDYSARPSLSAPEHFASAKAIRDLSLQFEEGDALSTEAAMQGVWHVEQAIAKGYSDRKQARVLLREMLWAVGVSKLECFSQYKDSKDPVIQKQCASIVAANERANNMTPELYRDYSDDPEIVSSYLVWISASGAKNAEKEVILTEALSHSKDRQLISELAYVLLDEGKFKEAKKRFIEALEIISNDYILADKMQKYVMALEHAGCSMPNDIKALILTIPVRYISESGEQEREQRVKEKVTSTKEELEDSEKLAAIKRQVIDAIRKAQCKVPGY